MRRTEVDKHSQRSSGVSTNSWGSLPKESPTHPANREIGMRSFIKASFNFCNFASILPVVFLAMSQISGLTLVTRKRLQFSGRLTLCVLLVPARLILKLRYCSEQGKVFPVMLDRQVRCQSLHGQVRQSSHRFVCHVARHQLRLRLRQSCQSDQARQFRPAS